MSETMRNIAFATGIALLIAALVGVKIEASGVTIDQLKNRQRWVAAALGIFFFLLPLLYPPPSPVIGTSPTVGPTTAVAPTETGIPTPLATETVPPPPTETVPSATNTPEPPTALPEPTSTPPPPTEQPTPAPSPTPEPTVDRNTKDGTVLLAGQTWYADGLELMLDKVERCSAFGAESMCLTWVLTNNTGDNVRVDFDNRDFTAVADGTKRLDVPGFVNYPGGRVECQVFGDFIPAGGSITNTGCAWKLHIVVDYANTSEVTVTVNFSRFTDAKWSIPINR